MVSSRSIKINLDESRAIWMNLDGGARVQDFKVRGYLGLLRRDGGTRFEKANLREYTACVCVRERERESVCV